MSETLTEILDPLARLLDQVPLLSTEVARLSA